MLGIEAILILLLGCSQCQDRGVLDCKKHSKESRGWEKEVQFCSVAAVCECGGSFWLDCPSCESGTESEKASKRRADYADWLQNDSVRKHLQRPVKRIETARFDLVLNVGPLKEGTKLVDPHTFIHRVARDLERVSSLIQSHYAAEEKDYSAKMRMWVWDSMTDHRSVMSQFLYSGSSGDFKMLGKDPVFSVFTEKTKFDDVPKLRALLVHNAPHMLLSNLYDSTWVGDIGGGWFDAGLGHWYEYQIFGRSVNYCIEEAEIPPGYKNGQWRSAIRSRVEKEDGRFLPLLFKKSTGNLGAAEHALCWSFYDWLVDQYPKALGPLLKGLKKKKSSEELFRETLGMGAAGAESAWRNWVKKSYPLEGDQPLKKQ